MEKQLQHIFTEIYDQNLWHMNQDESVSGAGSTRKYSRSFRKHLVKQIQKKKIRTVFDCSCGDWNWMRLIQKKLPKYVGNDIVEGIIRNNQIKYGNDTTSFVCNDAVSELKTYDNYSFDLIIVRHTLEHLPDAYNFELIREIKRVSKYAIITSYDGKVNQNEKLELNETPYRPINLNKNPYLELLGTPELHFWDSWWPRRKKGTHGFLYHFQS